jgi:hypothetical protein
MTRLSRTQVFSAVQGHGSGTVQKKREGFSEVATPDVQPHQLFSQLSLHAHKAIVASRIQRRLLMMLLEMKMFGFG